MLNINSNLCKKCNICISVCPRLIISIDNETNFPFLNETDEKYCVRCGHCVINCPSQAIKLYLPQEVYGKDEQFDELNLKFFPTQQQSEVFIKSRRTTRQFLETKVEHDKIMNILGIAKYAPTAANSQQVRWIIVDDIETKNKISSLYNEWLNEQVKNNVALEKEKRSMQLIQQGYDPIFRGANQFAAAVVPKEYHWYEDAAVAITYFELAAHSLSLGTCWCGYVMSAIRKNQEMREVLDIKDDEHIGGVILFGYPKLPVPNVLPPRKKLNIEFK